MNQSLLQGLGLTAAESRTYLALLGLGQTKTGPLIRTSGLQSSVVYNSLQSLKEKGLISWIVRGRTRYYQAASPQVLLELLEEKKRRFKELLPQLMLRQQRADKPFEAEVYEGTKAVLGMLLGWIKDAKPKEEYLFFSASKERYDKEIQQFFERYDAKRMEKKLAVRGIAHESQRSIFAHRVKQKLLQMRYVKHPILNGVSVFRDMLATIVWDDGEFSAVLIRSKAVADAYREFFEEVWGRAKP